MIRVAVVGMGNIGNTHARCYRQNSKCIVSAVCDVVKERADKAGQEFQCRAFYNVQDMIVAGGIDAASVATAGYENGGDHYDPTMHLLRAGIPVLGEKPISNDLGRASEMVGYANERRIAYAINLNHRFTPSARRAKEWLDSGRCGELNMINMTLWINNPNESSAHFHIRALHPHSLDVMRYFGGGVEKVHAFFKKGAGRTIWSNVQINLLFANGVLGHLVGSYDGGGPGHQWGLEECQLIGQSGRIIIGNACETLCFQARNGIETEQFHHLGGMKTFAETFQSRIDAWISDLINHTAPNEIDGKARDALDAQRIIEAAIESWENDTVINV